VTLKTIALLNLRRRKAKAAFVLAGLMIGVVCMVGMVSLAQTLSHEIAHKLEKYGANILITPQSDRLSLSYEGISLGGFSFETREIAQADLARIKQIKNAANLAAVGPVVLGAVQIGGSKALLAGVDFEAARFLKPWWKLQGLQPAQGQVILGSEAARLLTKELGGGLSIKGRELAVSGVLAPTGSQDDNLIFTTLPTAQDLLGKRGLVSMVEVAALCKDCPVDDMVAQISQMLPGAKVMAIQSVVKGRMETLSLFKNFALGVSGLVALVGSLVVLVTMMGNVKERTSEIGIFRAIGFRRSHIMRVVLWEAMLISMAAGLLGWLAGMGAGELALPWFSQSPDSSLMWDPLVGLAGIGLALVVGMGASFYPALAAARMDPHDALRTI
jgi:putative ABC transport system permease protein